MTATQTYDYMVDPANQRSLREERDQSLSDPQVRDELKATVIANDAERRFFIQSGSSAVKNGFKQFFRSGSSDPFERAAAHARQTIPTRTAADVARVDAIIEHARRRYAHGRTLE